MIQRAIIASLSKLADDGRDMVGSMTLLHYGDQKSSAEILIAITETVPTRAEDKVLQAPSHCCSPQGA